MNIPPTTVPSLSALPTTAAWSAYPTTEFGHDALAQAESRLAILPVHGWSDHGLGLSMDVEEVIGGAVLSAALAWFPAAAAVRVLPPLRHVLSPDPAGLGGIDPETLHEVIQEIAAGVKSAGYDRLLFLCTSPWNGEIVDAASRDVRVQQSLQTFVIELAGIGLHLHPKSDDRSRAQAVAAAAANQTPAPFASPDALPPTDLDFRPGNWRGPALVSPDPSLDGTAILAAAGKKLASLLQEVMARPGLSSHRDDRGEPAPMLEAPGSTPPAVFPAGRRSRYLPALTARELSEMSDRDRALVILPIGAIEQHGPHLPVGVDAYLAEAACAGLTAKLPTETPVWFGPSFCLGKSNEHLDYPGTLSLSARTLRRLLLAQIEALYALGFRQFALLNTHGGNSSVLVYTLREIQQRWGVRAGMLKIPSTPELSPQEATWGFHAGEWETSVMLALAPGLVRMERAISHYPASLDDPGELRPENAPAIYSWMTRDIAPDGVMGDATVATAEKGRRWFAAALDELAAQVVALVGNAP